MNVFSFRDDFVGAYERFSRSFVIIRAEDIKGSVEGAYRKGRLCPEPLLQLNPNFVFVDELVAKGALDNDESYVLTTGTGSGKSLTYFIPIGKRSPAYHGTPSDSWSRFAIVEREVAKSFGSAKTHAC